ncbi:uncharacterized protein LOC129210669 isoform X2 [Grus americana]|uniref:uncharacterized protein LOC129210669 isoform X2 n=1 Tax=Grus americana TaxID=9117 RepID=UPI002407DC2F|nr:uncharacterized protein LOC129210669 isoform X2 [Grus americana]
MYCLQHPGAIHREKEYFKGTQLLHRRVRSAQLVYRGTRVELQKMQPKKPAQRARREARPAKPSIFQTLESPAACRGSVQKAGAVQPLSGSAPRPGSQAKLITASGPGEELNFTNSQQPLWFWGVLILFHPLAPKNEFARSAAEGREHFFPGANNSLIGSSLPKGLRPCLVPQDTGNEQTRRTRLMRRIVLMSLGC